MKSGVEMYKFQPRSRFITYYTIDITYLLSTTSPS